MDRFLYTIKKLIPTKLFLFLRPVYHFLLSFSAAVFYGFPSRYFTVIGVTGTKGKTTVVELLHAILEESGKKTASISSLRFKIGGKETPNNLKMTMPGRFFLQKFLHEARRAGCTYAILEVTSEGIKQFRHRFTSFKVGVMTNVAPEHIEAHGSFENYLRAKLDLFWRLPKEGTAVINRDNPHAQRFSAATGAHKIFYGKDGIQISGKTIRVERDDFPTSLPGEFNFYNILAAVATGLSFHLDLEGMAEAIGRVKIIPGRMEYVQREPFAVVVDYAHTTDSLRKVYETLRNELVTGNQLLQERKLICVLGSAGGGRDKWKRPEFGKIADEFCSSIVLTDEDPYDEDPDKIMEEIASEILKKPLAKIRDRRAAIRRALQEAKAGDTVIITGKGAEPWIMGPHNTKIPWDDRQVVAEELKQV